MDSHEHYRKVASGFQKVINAVFFIIFGIIIGKSGLPGNQLDALQNVLYFLIFLCAIAVMYFGQFRGRQQKQKS
jgi:hypothetical protein